jgi:lysophospholipase L1-like esterase
MFLMLAVPARAALAQGQNGHHWVATWASAQQQGRGAAPARGAAPPAAAAAPPASPPALAPPATPAVPPPPRSLHDQTVRMIVRTSIGGIRTRVQLSNAYGTAPLDIGAAHVAIRNHDAEIVPESDRPLLFGGRPSVMIPPGAAMVSDPVDLAPLGLRDLAVSIYIPGDAPLNSGHSLALHTTYVGSGGNMAGAAAMADAMTTQAWYWLASVDVLAPGTAATVVTFGDSITDGLTSTANTDRGWPSRLAVRLAANHSTAGVAVANEGISGNRVLADGAGVSALARFDRDVIAISGVRWVMILESINDINSATRGPGVAPGQPITADTLIAALRQMIERAHTHGIKVIGCTLTPFGNDTEAGELMRTTVNSFIRGSGAFDAVVDFDAAVRDPNDPRQFRQGFNNSDRLHPNDAGYQAMADAVDLRIFTAKK